jgi:hypothetical protein
MIDAVCDQLIQYYEKPETQHKIQVAVLDPVVVYIGNKLWPVFLGFMISFVVLVLMMGYIIYLTMRT